MVSYDVIDLFTNIPLQEILEILRNKLQSRIHDLDTNLTIDSIINLVSSCFDTYYFTFNDNIYKQILPMGSPLSPLITEIFMTSFEENALSSAPFHLLCWYRKVDDTFTTIADHDDPTELLNHLLSTRESSSPWRPKLTTSFPYPEHLVMITKTINKTLQNTDPRPKPAPSATIPYEGPISHQISRLIKKKASIDVTVTSGKTIKTILHANGKGTSSHNSNPRGCIYQISCNCGDMYNGETLRPLHTRLKEHQASVNKSDLNLAVSEHLAKHPSHNMVWESTKTRNSNRNSKKPLRSKGSNQL